MLRNHDVDWDRWPVQQYLAENYRRPHAADLAVIEHHSAYYRQLAPDSLPVSLELGVGPNLYPLMLAAAASRRIHAVEPSAANLSYLRRQLHDGPDASWTAFYRRCRELNPALPVKLSHALARVRVRPGEAADLPAGRYALASMHFVAESVTEDPTEFMDLCRRFIAAVRPGGQVLAAFMERMGRYRLGTGGEWPGYPVDTKLVAEAFAPHTTGLELTRIAPDPDLPDYGYTGMLLLRACRANAAD